MTGRSKRFIGSLLVVLGTTLLLLSGAIGAMEWMVTEDDGFVMSDVHEVRSDTCCYFLVFLPDSSSTVKLDHRWVVEPKGDRNLSIGWMWFSDIDKVITNVSYETPPNWYREYKVISQKLDIPPGVPYNVDLSGARPSFNEPFWLWTKGADKGEKLVMDMDLDWEPKDVKQVMVFMNGDGSSGVYVDISYGTRLPLLLTVPVPSMVGGIILIVLGVALIIWARRK